MRPLARCLCLAAGCVMVALPAAAAPARVGAGDVALLVGGRFTEARVLALDAQGRTLAAGREPGTVQQITVCPGGRRSAEIVDLGSRLEVAIRELPSLELVRRFRVAAWNQNPFACLDANGLRVAFFHGSGPDLGRKARVVRITGQRATTIWRGVAWYASLSGRVGYVQALDGAGTRIVKVDLLTGTVRTLGTVPMSGIYELSPNVVGTRLAGDSYQEGFGDPRLVVIDLSRRPISVRTIPFGPPIGSTVWLSNQHFAYVLDTVSIFSDTLRRTTTIPRWKAGQPVVVGSTMFGIRYNEGRHRATIVSAVTPNGPVRVVRRLFGDYPGALASASG